MAYTSQALGVQTQPSYGTMDQMPGQGAYGVIPNMAVTQSPEPSAPPVSGYEGTTFGDGAAKYFPPPPDLAPGHGNKPHPGQTEWNIPAITEDEAKEAFVQYAASKCCYSKAPAKEMFFQNLQSFNIYRYRLETFTESRSSAWKTETYNGEAVDSYLCGTPPLPWDMKVEVPEMFKDKVKKIKVPFTSSLKGCPVCGCSGRRQCKKCHGCCREQCWVCSGRGYRLSDQRCTSCVGVGTVMKNNTFEYVADQRTGFPTELFKGVNGEKLFADEQYMVCPVLGFPDGAISQASRNAIEQHHTQFGSTARILRQRQTIELIFLTRVEYEWHGKSNSYYVYGNEHKVYAEDYPKKCCCTII